MTTSCDTYTARTTSVNYSWPSEITGLERIILSSQADLQRNLSAFFNYPITVTLVDTQAYVQKMPGSKLVSFSVLSAAEIASTSPATPITQERQIRLVCMDKVVCVATSTVRITSPECARLVLEEKYGIGQVFRRIAKVPEFDILAVGVGPYHTAPGTEGKQANDQLWRKYRVAVPEFECEILEVFPSREMFTNCEHWLFCDSNDSVSQLVFATKF
ncbi:hypothetical protein F5887DRAFT_886757 [Amanita rubescens]|nr:hypothetical protein F5887DRAFT_886757 [Amanita rubescens]